MVTTEKVSTKKRKKNNVGSVRPRQEKKTLNV